MRQAARDERDSAPTGGVLCPVDIEEELTLEHVERRSASALLRAALYEP
jgi:hypothetical protein